MEIISNQATPLRPEGDRVLDADLVEMDLTEFIRKIKEESTWAESDRNSMTIYKSDNLRIVLLGMRQNAELKTHQANGIISVQVLEGRITFSTAKKTVSLEQGQMIVLHENIEHRVTALTETFFLLTLAMTGQES
jgi:quercetin dioxygenase-like cupin family protein